MDRKNSVVRVAVAAAVWLLWLLAQKPLGIALPLIGTALAFGVIGDRKQKNGQEARQEAEEEPQTGESGAAEPRQREIPRRTEPARERVPEEGPADPELSGIIREGKLALGELSRLYALIPSERVRSLAMQMMELTDGMVEDGKKDSCDYPIIRRYFRLSLPTAIRILQEYDRRGEEQTAALLEQLLAGCRDQYDSLFENDAMDIENEIAAMEAKLGLDGLGPSDFGKD